ncbi:leucyl aminopeptidase [Ornithinimicrobium humiphilum]|uniref:Probable cytosol aminopeptidase n=1 Tax=Ornithinimicrobium humiphilum TaxID=125288 RepID=A0A543KN27_9MICO|nr:leucyl aminopeptidase [Ornithinimicrobium humiphilum]TQM96461.1 leucyl aminopeptidase [Ornithinimicrobium humiphilum]
MPESSPTALHLTDAAPGSVEADALVVGATRSGSTVTLVADHGLGAETASHLEETLTTIGAEASAEETVRLAGVPGVAAPLVVVVGMPSGPAPRTERLRRAAGVAARTLAGRARAIFALGQQGVEEAVAVAQGATLGAYTFAQHHGVGKASSDKPGLGEAVVPGVAADEAEAATATATTVVDAVRWARDLVNTPPNLLYPASMADAVAEQLTGSAVTVEVWDEARLEQERCGGILGVGQGSGRGPRLVTLSYAPEGATKHLALVGKGITFDSGGLCIKPGASMATMKCDMAGAATCAAAVRAIAELGLPVRVTAYLCLAENMTGDLAQRPGDIVTMRDGRTVEIINTDAEGRLVMADGIALATEQQPDAIVDVATLTGACVIALGERTLGVMGNDDELRDSITRIANEVGDTAWALPLPEEIRSQLDTPVADLKHTGERSAGAMVAAVFLQEFVGRQGEGEDAPTIPWAHLDIAGPAFNDKAAWGYSPKGATGSAVRTLVELARTYTA